MHIPVWSILYIVQVEYSGGRSPGSLPEYVNRAVCFFSIRILDSNGALIGSRVVSKPKSKDLVYVRKRLDLIDGFMVFRRNCDKMFPLYE